MIFDLILFGLIQTATPSKPSIEQLDWLIGDWTFTDRPVDPDDDYKEAGTRSCAYTLDRRYIRCLSKGEVKGSVRTSVFYFTYNEQLERFEILKLFGNIPEQGLHYGTVSENGHRFEMRNAETRSDSGGRERRGWAVIEYDGGDQYIWHIGWAPEGAEDRGPVRFRDIVTRASADGE